MLKFLRFVFQISHSRPRSSSRMDIPEEVPRNCPPVPTSLAQIDAEIERVTNEIVKLQEKELRTVTPTKQTSKFKPPKLVFHDLPDIQNLEIPEGFKRAPITFNYDPSKAEKLNALETNLRNLLEDERDRDVFELLKKIRAHQAANPFQEQRPSEASTKSIPNEDKLLAYLVPEYALIRNSS